VGEGRGEQTAPICGLGWGRGGSRWLAGGGTELTAGAVGGGGAPVNKRARGPAMQLQGEVKKVVGGLVWAMWGRSGACRCFTTCPPMGIPEVVSFR
jgi:hypothetical protein